MRGAYLHVESEREETRPLLFIERVANGFYCGGFLPRSGGRVGEIIHIYIYI
jgi:hypothetical protein